MFLNTIIGTMPSTLTWIDHDIKARERTLRILHHFQARESRDELGLGSVRDSLSDKLFPGTSTIQTRLRYMLIIPWIYQSLERKGVGGKNFARQADRLEREIMKPLLESDDSAGVFGRTSGKRLIRLPSMVYWAGLGEWNIRQTDDSRENYHRNIDDLYRRRKLLKASETGGRNRNDDIDFDRRNAVASWHPKLPEPPINFPDELSFTLTREEADFIQDRIQEHCKGSLLAFLALNCTPVEVDTPWRHSDFGRFSPEHQELLHHARLFSQTMHGASLLYNIQLAELRENKELIDTHRRSFEDWTGEMRLIFDEVEHWNLPHFWEQTKDQGHTIPQLARIFIERWIRFIRESLDGLCDNPEARKHVEEREKWLKGSRSRFTNKRALEQWGGRSGLVRFNYRWPNVRVLLADLHVGLEGE